MFPTTPVILVLVLTIATCGIAYWADNLGKQLGKKRLSLFGLRPRQTATLISMATSVIIMLLTLGVLLLFNRSLRNALLNYDRTKVELNGKLRELGQVKDKAATAESQLIYVGRQLDGSKEQLRAETKNAADAKKRTNAAREELKRAQSTLAKARQAETAARRGQAAARLAEGNAVAAREQAQRGAAELRGQLRGIRASMQRTRSELLRNGEQLKEKRKELENAGSRVKALNLQIDGLVKKRDELQKLYNALQQRAREGQNAINAYDSAIVEYGGVIDRLGQGEIAVGVGQVLAETRIEPNSDPAAIRVRLRQLLDAGAEAAVVFGAKPFTMDEEGSVARALHLAPLRTRGPRGDVVLTENVQIEQQALYLSTFKIPVSVRAIASRSYATGELAFYAQFQRVPIRRVFVEGETITSSTMDGNATDAQIFRLLLALVNSGEAVARQGGMSPVLSKENPLFFDFTTTNERTFDALREIQMQARQVRVRLVASEDTTTVDNLHVRFVVERLGN